MTKEIQLTQGKVALVDDDDFKWLSRWKWCYNNGYAVRANPKKDYGIFGNASIVSMHVQVMESDGLLDIDHINGNGLDNRKENLRICSRAENIRNSKKRVTSLSKYKGVSKHPYGWQVFIWNGSKNISIGLFKEDEEELAGRAYDKAAKEKYGQFARLNFPENQL